MTEREFREALNARAGGRCEECGGEGEIVGQLIHRLEQHHGVRRVDGGEHSLENVRLLCVGCHDRQPNGPAASAPRFEHVRSLRFSEKDVERLRALSEKLELSEVVVVRQAVKEKAEREGVE